MCIRDRHYHLEDELATFLGKEAVLLWSTGASSFTLRPRRGLESIFFHHPDAAVHVFANELPLDFFAAFQRQGFDLRVRRYDLAQLLGATPPFWRLLLHDPKLLVRLFGAVHSTAQFRLAGPGADEAASEMAAAASLVSLVVVR